MATKVNAEIMEVGSDVFVSFAIDSFKAGALTVDQNKLLETAISSGLYVFVLRDQLMIRLSAVSSNTMLIKFISDIVGKSALLILYRMIMGKGYKMIDILTERAIGEAVGMAFNMVMENIRKPANDRRQV